MLKRTSFDIKKEILNILKSKSKSYAELERKANTGFRTIKSNCDELKAFGFINIEKIENHPSNGKPFFLVKITEKGRKFINS